MGRSFARFSDNREDNRVLIFYAMVHFSHQQLDVLFMRLLGSYVGSHSEPLGDSAVFIEDWDSP